MLDRIKILTELQQLTDKLFTNIESEMNATQEIWFHMLEHQETLLELAAAYPNSPYPTWQGNLNDALPIQPYKTNYQVLAIDGSQIYPDKHQGTNCFVINIGGVVLRYGATASDSKLWSEPFVFIEEKNAEDTATLHDIVNGKREEFEFQEGLKHAIALKQENPNIPLVFLFDGSLIFWHLHNKNSAIKDYFTKRYTELLEEFYKHEILIAGYLSLTKSKDLTSLMNFYSSSTLAKNSHLTKPSNGIDDGIIMKFVLQPHHRSTIFKSNSPANQMMPEHIQPHFFYYDTGEEIARIEIPAHQALDDKKVNIVASLINNQVEKGLGYPIALAEAHEQAVIKSGERHMFYQLIDSLAIKEKKYLMPSQKNIKKRRMNV